MAEGIGPATPRSRKLWIDSSPFTLESLKDQQQKCKELSPPVVKLTHFAPKPCIEFGHVRVGKTKTVHLLVENPNPYDVDVKVEKFPWKKSFKLNEEIFSVMGDGYHVLEISWTPKERGNCREVIMMKYDLGFRVHAVVVGTAEETKKRANVRSKRNLGAAFSKKTKTMTRPTPHRSYSSYNDSENTNPSLLVDMSKHSDSTKEEEQITILTTGLGQTPKDVKVKLSSKEMHSAIRKALVPLHVVNSDNSRDSCGSITAPASPSGLEAPVIENARSPLFCTTENTVLLKVTEPMDTNCFDLKTHHVNYQEFVSDDIESNGRPTFFISKSKATDENAIKAPATQNIKVGLDSSPCLTPRSHRRSKTYTKPLTANIAADAGQFAASPANVGSNAPNLLDYALAMIAPSNETKVITTGVDLSSDSAGGGITVASIKRSGSSSEEGEPTLLSVSMAKTIPSSLCSTAADCLSSTYAHDKLDLAGSLPVPDISVIRSDSSMKLTDKKQYKSDIKIRPAKVQALKSVCKQASKPSPKIKPAKKVATPKRNVLQWRRECKGVGSNQSLKSSKIIAVKRISAEKMRPSPKRPAYKVVTHPRSAKKRKVKVPVKRLVLKSNVKASAPAKVTLGMPFLSRNRFYDEKWRQKQEHAFSAWLNFILTPDEFKTHFEWNAAIGMTKKDKQKSMTKETASLRAYEIEKRRQQLRRAGFLLYETDQFTDVVQNIEEAVESFHISLREDKQLWADIGNRAKVVNLLMAFNPLWLRLGLEIAFAEERVTLTSLDSAALSNFITKKLLSNGSIEKEFAHPSVPHSYRAGYNEAISKHMLKKFLILIFFLDQAKQKRLIDHDPCLFNKGAGFRNCKDILQVFSRDLLRGEGDIIKHLGFLGYRVNYQQTYIDEFDFGIGKIAVDLRDGIRLVRIVELLFHRHGLTSQLRVPAGSLLQKKHNVNIALRTLVEHGVDMCDANGKKIEAEQIVKGHCEMTLALLWNMALFFQVEGGVNTKTLKSEIEYLQKILKLKRSLEDTTFQENEELGHISKPALSGVSSLLLEWTRLVCAFKSVPVYNFSASFSDGRVLACLIAHYQSNLVSQTQINMVTTFNQNEQQSSYSTDDPHAEAVSQTMLLKNEKANLRLVQNALYEMGGVPNLLRIEDVCNTIPDEKVVRLLLSYLCSRLLDISSQDRAARVIQVSWRAYKYRTKILAEKMAAEELERRRNRAAIGIQSAYRRYRLRLAIKRKTASALVIQRAWRRRQDARPLRVEFLRMKNAAIKIQACFRGTLARKHVAELRDAQRQREHAAFVIQNFSRSILARKWFCTMRVAATTIQHALRNYWLGKHVRESYLNYRRAVVTIQIRWRATYLMRREVAVFTTKRESAIVIQRAYRRHCRLKRVYATMVLQRFWRKQIQTRKIEEREKLEEWAACTIQAHWRSVLAKRRVAELRKKLQAAVLIQRYWRGFVLMKKERKEYATKRCQIIKIQSLWRRHVAQNRVRDLKLKIRYAVFIQHKWRATLEMRTQQKSFQIRRSSVVTIQSHWRGVMVRRRVLHERRNIAATKIQVKWRATLEMRVQMQNFERIRKSAVVIQSYWRSFSVRKILERRRKAVQIIRKYWRGFRQMAAIRAEFLMKKKAALKIQSAYRGYVARQLVARTRLKIRSAVTIQQRWRATLSMRNDRNIFQTKRRSAVVIQSYWKGHLERRLWLKKRRSAMIIQTWWRAMLEMMTQHKRFELLVKSTVLIQSYWRCYIVRRNMTRKRDAAITIQKYWRGFVSMKRCMAELQMTKTAAVKVQSAWRGRVARRSVQILKLQTDSAIIIQRQWRATLVMRNQRREFQATCRSVIKIQSHWRGYAARKRISEMKKSAVAIQTRWRAALKMRRQRREFKNIRTSTVLIQSSWRGYVVRKRLQLQRKSAAIIQKYWRGFVSMRQQRENFIATKHAVAVIQSCCRGYAARKLAQKMRQERRSAIVIQQHWRAVLEMRMQKFLFQTKRANAIVIQSYWRGLTARKQLRQMQKSAATIQTWWKGIVEMKRRRNAFLTMRTSSLLIQSYWRSYVVRKNIKKMHVSAIIIQKFWSGYTAMKTHRDEFLMKKHAVLKIQAFLRGFMARKSVLEMTQQIMAATMIQQKWRAVLKMRQHRRKFIIIKKSAVMIQKTWKGYVARKRLEVRKESAEKIQRYWRQSVLMKKLRAEFTSMRLSAVKIQCAHRQYIARKILQRKKLELLSVIVIQQKWRAVLEMRLQRQMYLNIKKCCVVIQNAWRCYITMKQQREAFISAHNAAVTIQCAHRQYTARKILQRIKLEISSAIMMQQKRRAVLEMRTQRQMFLHTRQCCVIIQNAWRGFLARQRLNDLRKRNDAAIVMQQWAKSTSSMRQQRRAYQNLKSATVLIQRRWRQTLYMRECRNQFLHRKSCVVIIQSFGRMIIARNIVSQMRSENKAAQFIQQTWQNYKLMKTDRKKFLKTRNAAIIIQSIFRGAHARREYNTLKMRHNAATTIQAWFKRVILARQIRHDYLQQINAALVIKKFFRRVLQNKEVLSIKRHRAAIVIQQKWKATLTMRKQRTEYLHIRSSIIIAQSYVRRYLALAAYKRIRSVTVMMQRKFRSELRARRDRKHFINVTKAVMLIQRVYRGYRVRKDTSDKKIVVAKLKCVEACRNALQHPEQKICNRMNSALTVLLRAKSYDVVYSTLEDLISLSKLLPYCCERISADGGTEVLCRLIMSSNRSFHAAFVLHFCISILLNLLKNHSTRYDTTKVLMSEKDGVTPIEMLVTVLSRFREKGNRDPSHAMVFCSACSLLLELCRECRNVKMMKSKQKSIEMIKFIAKETNTKRMIKKQKQAFQKKRKESSSFLTLSSTPVSKAPSFNNTAISCRETSFTKRVASPRLNLRRSNNENIDPSSAKKTDRKDKKANQIVTSLFSQENSSAPKIKQALGPRKALWHTNVPIQRSKQVTKPHSPKFCAGRARILSASTCTIEKITVPSPQQVLPDVELKSINFDCNDQGSCINTLAKILS